MNIKEMCLMVALTCIGVLITGAAIHYGQRMVNPEVTGCWDTCEAAGFDHGRYNIQGCLCFGSGVRMVIE